MSDKPNGSEEKHYIDMDDIEGADDTQYDDIDMRHLGWPGWVRVGSLNADDLIEWTEANETPTAKRTAGLRLIVKSLVGPPPANKRIGNDKHLATLRRKSHKATEIVIEKIIALNGLVVKKGEEQAAKNV